MRKLLRLLLVLPVVLAPLGCGDEAETTDRDDAAPPEADAPAASATGEPSGITVEGFSGPESAVHDTRADVYLVSNVAGPPAARDAEGFISRVSPDGEVLDLRFIDGADEGVTLDAPKGLDLRGDTLFVADIDAVRLYHRASGEPLGSWTVDGASFLNDVTVAADGTIYVSDSGASFVDGEAADSGTSTVHVFSPDGARRTIDTGDLAGINGLAAVGDRLYGVTYGSGKIFFHEDGALSELPELPGLGLDGIVVTDRGLLISDWDTESVYLLRENGSVATVLRNVPSPADIGIDRRRNRLLVPGLTSGNLLLAPLAD